MILTTEATKSAIASGKLAAFSLDTSVFESQQMALERGLLKRLQQFKGSKIKIVLADVVSREVIAHIQQRANSTKASVEKALAEVQNTWPTTKETCTAFMKQIFEQRSSAVSAELRFADFLESVGAEIAPCARVSLEVLTSKYFESHPPFGDGAKRKSEFPDAISLMTLEAWAESNGVLMLVVSKDKAWSEYCVTSQCLVCTDDLSNALSVFQEESGEFACKQITKMILSGDKIGVIDTIKNAVRTQWAKMGLSVKAKSTYPYKAGLLTQSFTDITVLWLEGDKLLYPIEQRDNLLVARAVVHLDVEFRCDFLIDFTENGSVSGTTEATIPATVNYTFSVGVLVTFRGHIPDAVTLVEAELLPTEIAVDFREIP